MIGCTNGFREGTGKTASTEEDSLETTLESLRTLLAGTEVYCCLHPRHLGNTINQNCYKTEC